VVGEPQAVLAAGVSIDFFANVEDSQSVGFIVSATSASVCFCAFDSDVHIGEVDSMSVCAPFVYAVWFLLYIKRQMAEFGEGVSNYN